MENYSNKKLIIIQSNFTNIFEQLDIFPLHVLIIKCDPLQQMVFYMKNKNEIIHIKSTEDYYLKLVEQFKNKEKIWENKVKRLNMAFKNFQNNYESYNCNKLIKECPFKETIIISETQQYFFFEYTNLIES